MTFEGRFNVQEFLFYEDWLDTTASPAEWITVARNKTDDLKAQVVETFFTFSALVKNTPKKRERIVSTCHWEIDTMIGRPLFERTSRGIRFDDNWIQDRKGLAIEPFTVFRLFDGLVPSRFEIAQSFILYHNLYWSRHDCSYRHPPDDDIVVRIKDGEQDQHIEVRANLLRDFLSARKACLVRYHDHVRLVSPRLAHDAVDGRREIRTKERRFCISVDANNQLSDRVSSRLLGKDLIGPLREPIHRDYVYLRDGKFNHRFARLIVDIDSETGMRIEESCGENSIAPHQFLRPVYFRRTVLRKYYQETRRYTVTPSGVSCLSLWSISYGLNGEGLVQVWLGDLGRMPHDEQIHWRSFNVPPSGGVSESLYRQQILAQWVEVDDPVWQLVEATKKLNEAATTRLGFEIFTPLTDADSHIVKSVHVPLDDEVGELDEQIQYLAKILPDSINKGALLAFLGADNESAPIEALRRFVDEVGADGEAIVEPIRALQTIRSKGVAHRRGRGYAQALRRFGLSELTNVEIFRTLALRLAESVQSIARLVTEEPGREGSA